MKVLITGRPMMSVTRDFRETRCGKKIGMSLVSRRGFSHNELAFYWQISTDRFLIWQNTRNHLEIMKISNFLTRSCICCVNIRFTVVYCIILLYYISTLFRISESGNDFNHQTNFWSGKSNRVAYATGTFLL